MKFRLIYEGPLKSNGGIKDKQEIRRQVHPQLRDLWNQKTLQQIMNLHVFHNVQDPDNMSLPQKWVGDYRFIPIVGNYLRTICHLDVLFLRPEEPGSIFSQSGDIDNRMKTLLDGLRIPDKNQIPREDSPRDGEIPFFCLLEDDKLVTQFSVTTDRLLGSRKNDKSHVLLIMTVNILITEKRAQNWGIDF